jgi:hypothetical protein
VQIELPAMEARRSSSPAALSRGGHTTPAPSVLSATSLRGRRRPERRRGAGSAEESDEAAAEEGRHEAEVGRRSLEKVRVGETMMRQRGSNAPNYSGSSGPGGNWI